MAAYGEDSSRSALTFIPPVTRVIVSRPLESPKMSAYGITPYITVFYPYYMETNLRSVTWTKVSLNEAKMRATPKTFSPVVRMLAVIVPNTVETASTNHLGFAAQD